MTWRGSTGRLKANKNLRPRCNGTRELDKPRTAIAWCYTLHGDCIFDLISARFYLLLDTRIRMYVPEWIPGAIRMWWINTDPG